MNVVHYFYSFSNCADKDEKWSFKNSKWFWWMNGRMIDAMEQLRESRTVGQEKREERVRESVLDSFFQRGREGGGREINELSKPRKSISLGH